MQILIDAIKFQVVERKRDFCNFSIAEAGDNLDSDILEENRLQMLENCTNIIAKCLQLAALHDLPLEANLTSKIFNPPETYKGSIVLVAYDEKRIPRNSVPYDVIKSVAKLFQSTIFQSRVFNWMLECFSMEVLQDKTERGDRLLEETLELLQSGGYAKDRIAALTEYVYSRPVGEQLQELGGVRVTLAAYCIAHNLDENWAAETELERVWGKIDEIRQKQATKPTGSALPQ